MKGIFKKSESESGAAIIEFALGVPFLLILPWLPWNSARFRRRQPLSTTPPMQPPESSP